MSETPSIWTRLRRLFRGDQPFPPESQPVPKPAAPIISPAAVEPVPPKAPLAVPEAALPIASTLGSGSPVTGAPVQAAPVPPEPLALAPVPAQLVPRIATVAGPTTDLVLGLDLGTSCSKVVIGDPGWKNKSYAVSFKKDDGGISNWLNPTRFGSEANLKMRLMNNPKDEQVRDHLACYLASVIRQSRSWFADHGPADYRHRDLRWSLNLGFPAKSVDGSPLSEPYREIARTAIGLASQEEKLAPELAARIRCGQLQVQPFMQPTRVNLYPEIAAQLAGYINSPHRKPGNLLLIDVGAGTLDVSTIILHEDRRQDIVSFHFCEVEELGVLRLYEKRREGLNRVHAASVCHSLDDFQDGLRPIPEEVQEMVENPSPALQQEFSDVTGEFADRVLATSLRCLVRFRQSQREIHVNRGFDPWGKNLRFFLTGGGCRSAFYRRLLADGALEDLLAGPYTRWKPDRHNRQSAREGLLLERLPMPSNLENFPPKLHPHFDRLSVAYGLALGGGEDGNLMKITSATYS